MQVEKEKLVFAPSLYTSLRVSDVERAREFYQKLGFKQTFALWGHQNETVLCFLQYGSHPLILGKLTGLPYPETAREKAIQQGPRGLGVKVAFNVPDLDLVYRLCQEEHCEIMMEPMEEVWGERIFTCLDPSGYELQLHQQTKVMTEAELTKAYRDAWLQ